MLNFFRGKDFQLLLLGGVQVDKAEQVLHVVVLCFFIKVAEILKWRDMGFSFYLLLAGRWLYLNVLVESGLVNKLTYLWLKPVNLSLIYSSPHSFLVSTLRPSVAAISRSMKCGVVYSWAWPPAAMSWVIHLSFKWRYSPRLSLPNRWL